VHPKVLNVPIQCITVRDKSALKDTTVQYTVIKSKSTTRLASTEATNGSAESGAEGIGKIEVPVQVVFINDNGAAKLMPVLTGISNDTNIEVTGGLQEGQEIITGPYRMLSRTLKDGDRIKTKKEKEEKAAEKKTSS
jgi:HlyD family secretion protein